MAEEVKKQFAELTSAERRIALAEEVLARLSGKWFSPTSGTYLRLQQRVFLSEADPETQLRDVLPSLAHCQVCALGALFVAAVALDDKVAIADAFLPYQFHEGVLDIPAYSALNYSTLTSRLAPFFGQAQANLIEAAFETSFCRDSGDTQSYGLAIKFGRRFRTSKARLTAIMKNLIANDGTFRPEVEL